MGCTHLLHFKRTFAINASIFKLHSEMEYNKPLLNIIATPPPPIVCLVYLSLLHCINAMNNPGLVSGVLYIIFIHVKEFSADVDLIWNIIAMKNNITEPVGVFAPLYAFY